MIEITWHETVAIIFSPLLVAVHGVLIAAAGVGLGINWILGGTRDD